MARGSGDMGEAVKAETCPVCGGHCIRVNWIEYDRISRRWRLAGSLTCRNCEATEGQTDGPGE